MTTQPTPKKIVLAYSGGLDTSIILPWLKERYPGCEVIAFAAELGQGSELLGVKKKAIASGADKCVVADLRKEFVTDYIWPMIRARAIYERSYLLGTSIARPLIAAKQVECALAEGADALAHGATGKGNDQVRFELTFMALAPQLQIIAPWKDPSFELTSREAAIEYAKKHKIPISMKKGQHYSRDRNLWHISHEGLDLEEPANEPKDDLFTISNSIAKAPAKPGYVTVHFKSGTPVKIEIGKKSTTNPVKIVSMLNEIGGKHAVGQDDLVENRLVGIKSRGVYETPGGTILYTAMAGLESLCLDRDTVHYKDIVAARYADLVYNGKWFMPLRESLDAFFAKVTEPVTGKVRLRLFKGNCRLAGVTSPNSLYDASLGSFVMGADYDPTDAIGFIRLFGLQTKVNGLRKRKKGGRGKK